MPESSEITRAHAASGKGRAHQHVGDAGDQPAAETLHEAAGDHPFHRRRQRDHDRAGGEHGSADAIGVARAEGRRAEAGAGRGDDRRGEEGRAGQAHQAGAAQLADDGRQHGGEHQHVHRMQQDAAQQHRERRPATRAAAACSSRHACPRSALIGADYARGLERYHRTQSKAFGGRAQRGGVHVDALLDDPAVAQAELVDAAPVEALCRRRCGVFCHSTITVSPRAVQSSSCQTLSGARSLTSSVSRPSSLPSTGRS